MTVDVSRRVALTGGVGVRAVGVVFGTVLLGVVSVVGSGCAAGGKPVVRASLAHLQARSAFDLQFPNDQLLLNQFDDRTKGVTGCGRRLTKVEQCSDLGQRRGCSWVIDAPAEQPPASVPVAAAVPEQRPPAQQAPAAPPDPRSAQAPVPEPASVPQHLPGSIYGPPDPGF
jgi:hypothetical protein